MAGHTNENVFIGFVVVTNFKPAYWITIVEVFIIQLLLFNAIDKYKLVFCVIYTLLFFLICNR